MLLIASVVVFVVFLLVKWYQFNKLVGLLDIPGPKPIPIIGNAHQIATADSFTVRAVEWLNEYGSIIQVFILSKRIIVIGSHPEAVKEVFLNKAFMKGIIAKDFEDLLGKTGMIFSDGEIWSRVRKTCTGAFNTQHLRIFEEPIKVCITNLINKLKAHVSTKSSQKTIDMDAFFVQVTLDIMGRTMLSTDFEALNSPESHLSKQSEIYLREMSARITNPLKYINPRATHLYKTSVKYLKDQTANVINQRMQTRAESNQATEHKDLLDLLLDAQNPDSGVGLTQQEIKDQVLTFLLAGHETTAHTLSFAIACIARNPEISRKIIDELNEVLGKDSQVIPDYAQCSKLPYLTAVIKETLRMHPIAPMIFRQLEEDLKIGGYNIPKETLVAVDLIALHHNPQVWEDPFVFNPARFLNISNDSDDSSLSYFAYSPFGHGKRSCLGQHFAMLEMKMILSTVIRKFAFRLLPLLPVSPIETITIRPKGGLKMTVWEL